MIQRRLSYILLLAMGLPSFAQNPDPWVAGINLQYGAIIPHSEAIRNVAQTNPYGVSLNISNLQLSESSWNYCFCYPKLGVAFTVYDYQNPEVIGKAYIFDVFVEPQFRFDRPLFYTLKTNIGLAFMSNPFDPVENPTNKFYSSVLNFRMTLGAGLGYKLNNRWILKFEALYNHVSNGGIKDPNKGINFPTVALGVEYVLRDYEIRIRKKKKGESYFHKLKYWDITIFGSGQTVNEFESTIFPLYGVYVGHNWAVLRKSALMVGMEWVNDGALRENTERNGSEEDHNRISALMGHDWLIGKFLVGFQIGYYLYSPINPLQPVYQRYVLRYVFEDRFTVGASIKAHGDVADFLDFRLGMLF